MVKTVLETDDLFVVGTRDGKYDGDYKPTVVPVNVVAAGLAPFLPPASTGLFAQTVNSPTITNTNVESSIAGTGVGSLSVPANGFQVGDSFHAKLIGMLSAGNNHTVRIRIKSGTVLLADTGVITLGNVSNRPFEINVYFTIKTLGAAGVASIVSGGIFSYTKNASTSFEGTGFNSVNNTTFNTTISNTLDITAQFGQTSASDSIYSDLFILHKLY
jgi:hypothetical protein